MLESSSSSNVMQMGQKGDQPNDNQNQSDSNQQKNNTQTKENFLGNMIQGPSNQELDVRLQVKMSFNLLVLQQQSVLFLLLYLQPMY